MLVGIVSALPIEAQSLTQSKPAALSHHQLPGDIRLYLCGTGADGARKVAQQLISEGAPALLSWGIVGALNPEIHSGDVVLPEKITANGSGQEYFPDRVWLRRVQELIPSELHCHGGTLLSSGSIVATKEAKQSLFQHSGACAVDMEGAAIAEAALFADIPYLAIRVALDEARQGIPVCAQVAVDTKGHDRPMSLLASLLRHPGEIPSLIALSKSYMQAQQSLRTLAKILSPDLLIRYNDNNKS